MYSHKSCEQTECNTLQLWLITRSETCDNHNIPTQPVKVRLSTKQNELEVMIIKNK